MLVLGGTNLAGAAVGIMSHWATRLRGRLEDDGRPVRWRTAAHPGMGPGRLAAWYDRIDAAVIGAGVIGLAVARALAPRPSAMLMDEPFSNLDISLRERLCLDVRQILKKLGISGMLVTHNQHEAFAMADVIGVMRDGALEQWDTAYNLYHRPKSQYVADFVGEGVLIQGQVITNDQVNTQLGNLKGRFSYPCRNGCHANVLIRPDDIIHDDSSPFKAKIIRKRFRGANILYTLQLQSDEEVIALVWSHHNH